MRYCIGVPVCIQANTCLRHIRAKIGSDQRYITPAWTVDKGCEYYRPMRTEPVIERPRERK